jgi:hypothetical protein
MINRKLGSNEVNCFLPGVYPLPQLYCEKFAGTAPKTLIPLRVIKTNMIQRSKNKCV